jgi:hypothetical protein
VNATPYLYNVPADLACFAPLLKAFGVRDAFGCSDFVQVRQCPSSPPTYSILQKSYPPLLQLYQYEKKLMFGLLFFGYAHVTRC